MPETLTFFSVVVAELLLVGAILVVMIVIALATDRIRYPELRALALALLLTVGGVGYAASRWETPVWLVGLWALGGLAVAVVSWAAVFYAVNAIVTRGDR